MRAALPEDVRGLIREAERKAQIFTGYVRLLVVAWTLGMFLLAKPGALPIDAFVFHALSYYAVASVASIVLAASRWFRTWHGSAFICLDAAVLAVFLDTVMRSLGLPPTSIFSTPAFVFLFVILALAAMRYTATPVFLAFGVFAAGHSVLSGLDSVPWVEAYSGDPFDLNQLYGDYTRAMRFSMVALVVGVAALAVHRARTTLVRAITLGQESANLARYLPKPVADLVAAQGVSALSRGQRQPAAVMFVDIRDFTALSEAVEPETIGKLLGELRALITGTVERHDGIVDKFIGDGVMAVFGIPHPAERDAANALAAAREILSALESWNATRAELGAPALRLGIGLHHGEVFAGAIGDAARLEFTILGDTVNVAARTEEMTKSVGTSLVVTEALLAASGEDFHAWQLLEDQVVRGRRQPMRMFKPAGGTEVRR